MERHAAVRADLSDGLDGLDHARLVVAVHHGDQRRAVVDEVRHGVRVYPARVVHGGYLHLGAQMPRGMLRRVQNRMMLHGRHNDTLPRPGDRQNPPEHGQIVGLSAAGHEKDLARVRPDERRHLLPGIVHRAPRRPPEPVERPRVAEAVA